MNNLSPVSLQWLMRHVRTFVQVALTHIGIKVVDSLKRAGHKIDKKLKLKQVLPSKLNYNNTIVETTFQPAENKKHMHPIFTKYTGLISHHPQGAFDN